VSNKKDSSHSVISAAICRFAVTLIFYWGDNKVRASFEDEAVAPSICKEINSYDHFQPDSCPTFNFHFNLIFKLTAPATNTLRGQKLKENFHWRGGDGERKTLLCTTVSLHNERIPCPVLLPYNPHPGVERGEAWWQFN
jgi:hypothetical protein